MLISDSTKCIFRGIGEIMLASNGYTGLFFLVGLYYENSIMATVALSCTIISTLTAVIFKFNKDNIMEGLYGFNSSLIGCAMVFYLELNIYVVIGFIIGSIVSTLIMEFFLRNNLPAYTFPFIFTTWILLWILRIPGITEPKAPSDTIDYKVLIDYAMPAHSFGQVLFLGDCISGLLVLIGVYIWSPIAALYGIISTIISAGISNYFIDVNGSAVSIDRIHAGLYGFNAVLCGIAQSGKKPIDGIYVLLSLIISTTFYIMLIQNSFTSLTFPFVLSMWFCCILKFIISNYTINNNSTLEINDSTSLCGIKQTKIYKNFKFVLKKISKLRNRSKKQNNRKYKNSTNIDNLNNDLSDITLKNIITNNNNILLNII
ncbi:hypothetical protein RB653_003019 [Dictyostelium firmibasis]|uniref:Urea transporter n=1 Tax=Dictyostelium firmibasis TaxID=79012 RepID=A0AAN7TXK1_9MYCE